MKNAFLLFGILSAIGLVVWPGCAFMPVTTSRTAISSLSRKEVSSLKRQHPTRDEIARRIGESDAYFPGLRVACYKLNKVSRREVWLLFGILPVGATKAPDRVEIAMIQFDDRDRMERYAVKLSYDSKPAMFHTVKEWVTGSARRDKKS